MEKIFNETKLWERTWAKLVNLDTYCDEPERRVAAYCYDLQIRQRKSVTQYFGFFLCFYIIYLLISIHLCAEMEDSKRRAYIKQQVAAKKKQEGS